MSNQAHPQAQAQQKTLIGSSPKNSLLQRTCTCGQHTIAGGECSICRSQQSTLQRSQSAPEQPPTSLQENVLAANSSSGAASLFDHDFSQIPLFPGDTELTQRKTNNTGLPGLYPLVVQRVETWSAYVKRKAGNSIATRLGKKELYDFLVNNAGQDATWAQRFLSGIEEKWVGNFALFGGRVSCPEGLQEICRVLEEAGQGQIKKSIFDYAAAGLQQPDGRWRYLTKDFVEKHVLGDRSTPTKHGKERMATQQNVTLSSVITPRQARDLNTEAESRQSEYAKEYNQRMGSASTSGEVVRNVEFTSRRAFDAETYAATGKETSARGHIQYSVVEIDGKYLINHFARVV